MKTKIKAHGAEVIDFYDKTFPKVDYNDTCLAVINLDSALKKSENYYSKAIFKVCKYVQKKVARPINGNLSDFPSSDESDKSAKEKIKAVCLSFESVFFEGTINTSKSCSSLKDCVV